MSDDTRPTLYRVSLEHPERDVDGPALRALYEKGYRVDASLAIEGSDGVQSWLLLLATPVHPRAHLGRFPWLWGLLAQVALVAVVSGLVAVLLRN